MSAILHDHIKELSASIRLIHQVVWIFAMIVALLLVVQVAFLIDHVRRVHANGETFFIPTAQRHVGRRIHANNNAAAAQEAIPQNRVVGAFLTLLQLLTIIALFSAIFVGYFRAK